MPKEELSKNQKDALKVKTLEDEIRILESNSKHLEAKGLMGESVMEDMKIERLKKKLSELKK